MKINLLNASNIRHKYLKVFKINYKKFKKFKDLEENNKM